MAATIMDPVLGDAELEQFQTRGYVVVRHCFSHELAERWIDRAFARLGYDRRDPTTWKEGRVHLPSTTRLEIPAHMPKLWAAQCQLLGGEERVRRSYVWDSISPSCETRERVRRRFEADIQRYGYRF